MVLNSVFSIKDRSYPFFHTQSDKFYEKNYNDYDASENR